MRSPTIVLLGVAVLMVAAACSAPIGGATPPPSATAIPYPTGAADLVLRVRSIGGFAPAIHRDDLPTFSLYGDGTVIVVGPTDMLYPGHAMPNLQRATVSPAGMERLLEAARDAGLLGADAHYEAGGIMDAMTVEFTLNAGGGSHTISAYALFEGVGPDPAMAPDVAAARARLLAFETRLGAPEALFGADIGPWTAYRPASVGLTVTPGAPDDGSGLVGAPIAWPLATPLASFVGSPAGGSRCAVVTGPDLEALWPLFERATTMTGWTDAGGAFGVALRPLLPGETCSTLGS